ncbi:MAG: type IV pilin N-terminal domain-containing protein [Halobacteria archaeon]
MKNQMRKNFAKDEEAVSPVVGVILMVAITVILAAIIAAFVLGLGSPKKAPSASLKLNRANATAFCIEHQGGDAVDFDAPGGVTILIGGAASGQTTPAAFTTDPGMTAGEAANIVNTATIAAGTEIRLVDNVSNGQIAAFRVQNLDTATTLTCP